MQTEPKTFESLADLAKHLDIDLSVTDEKKLSEADKAPLISVLDPVLLNFKKTHPSLTDNSTQTVIVILRAIIESLNVEKTKEKWLMAMLLPMIVEKYAPGIISSSKSE